jgi:thiamine-phosphate pyrophosphorylase
MIQFISHFNDKYTYLDSVKIALDGGCRWVQLRMKDSSDEVFIETALKVKQLCADYHSVMIIDDRVHLVEKLSVGGVHVGKNDMSVEEVRKILGKKFIVGATANTFEDAFNAFQKGADYVGCGPFRFTTTKKNLSPILGLEGYRSIMSGLRNAGISKPVVAIGGITKADIPSLAKTGVSGIALSGTVLNASDPVKEMKEIIKIFENEWTN